MKVSVGGGGKGMCFVESDVDFGVVFDFVKWEVSVVFGDDWMLIEKYVFWVCYVEV